MASGFVLVLAAGIWSSPRAAPRPELEVWHLNKRGLTGYGGFTADVQRIRYSACSAYINASGIPLYGIGSWPGSPVMPSVQNWLVRIPRGPVENTGALTPAAPGAIGMLVNGVELFSALDSRSYGNQGLWHENAVVAEAATFDTCLGHLGPGGAYCHHQISKCLYTADPTRHSPILGYAFDGFPIYGSYGFKNSDGSGGIVRIRSSYRLRAITDRTTLPDGTVLSPLHYGPSIASVPLGYYVEDFEYVAGLGDLDASNGRRVSTPEYPEETYAYFATIDEAGASVYPYSVGPRYFGAVAMDDVTSRGHVTVSGPVQDYTPSWVTDERGAAGGPALALSQSIPNPAGRHAMISFALGVPRHVRLGIYDIAGREVQRLFDGNLPAGVQTIPVDAARLSPGVYFYRLRAGEMSQRRTMIIAR